MADAELSNPLADEEVVSPYIVEPAQSRTYTAAAGVYTRGGHGCEIQSSGIRAMVARGGGAMTRRSVPPSLRPLGQSPGLLPRAQRAEMGSRSLATWLNSTMFSILKVASESPSWTAL